MSENIKALLKISLTIYALMVLSAFGVFAYNQFYGTIYFSVITTIIPIITIGFLFYIARRENA